MKKYALINYSTGEIFSMSSENDRFTARTLYRRADRLRRESIRYGDAQSTLELINCSKCPNTIRDGIVICQWAGGTATPVEEMGFSVRTLHHLQKRGAESAFEVASYAMGIDIFSSFPRREILEIERIIRPYDEEAARILRRHINQKRGEKWGL